MALEHQSTCEYMYIHVCEHESVFNFVWSIQARHFQVYYIDFLSLIISPLVSPTPINSPFSIACNLVQFPIQVQTFNYFNSQENWKQPGTLP